jgi:pSer/pThr/pTyr-binding forkhead associated (FHA) protein
MIQCSNCTATFAPGVLFCSECGQQLFEGQDDGRVRSWTQAHFVVANNGRKQSVPLCIEEPIVIGRADPDEGHWPQLDLTADEGQALGVSRRHAIMTVMGGNVVLIDQASVNGTWIGEEKLLPEEPSPIPETARLRFGNLTVHIVLE